MNAVKLIFGHKMRRPKNLGFSNFEGNNQITWFCYDPPYKLCFTICDFEKLLPSLLLMPLLWDSTSNEPSFSKTFESGEIFHLSSTQYSVFTKHCTLQWPWKTTNFFISNAAPIRQHLKRTVFKQNVRIRINFSLI